jgi:hypothetical protein
VRRTPRAQLEALEKWHSLTRENFTVIAIAWATLRGQMDASGFGVRHHM